MASALMFVMFAKVKNPIGCLFQNVTQNPLIFLYASEESVDCFRLFALCMVNAIRG